jgi:hypothetical protein
VEMAVCEQLEVCTSLNEENLEPVVRKLERAMETNQLDFATTLDDDDIKTRVGRLLCGLNYKDFCTAELP